MSVQHILAFVIFSLFFEANLLAQDTPEPRKHSIHIEAFGRSLLWASVNYEHQFHKHFSMGLGLGFANLERGQIISMIDNQMESGRYFELRTTQLLSANGFLGKGKNQLHITGGLTNFYQLNRRKYDSKTEFYHDVQIRWNFGMGYQFINQRSYFRATVYLLELPEPTGIFPKVFPWVGLTGGLRF